MFFLFFSRYSNAWLLPTVRQGQEAKRAAQKAAIDALVKDEGMRNIHYVRGDGKLESLGEAQYSATGGIGVHPTSIAHLRMAQYVAGELGRLGVL